MIAVMLVAAGMCLQGGEQVDVSQYVSATARLLELKVTLAPANGTLVVYSPGYEEQRAQFSEELSFGRIPFAEPVLCIRSIGGPFEFNIDIVSIEDLDRGVDRALSPHVRNNHDQGHCRKSVTPRFSRCCGAFRGLRGRPPSMPTLRGLLSSTSRSYR